VVLYDAACYLSKKDVAISSPKRAEIGIQSPSQEDMGTNVPSEATISGYLKPQPGPVTSNISSSTDIQNEEKIDGSSNKLGSGSGAGMVFPF